MTLRHTSIRTRMFLLVSVPLLALIAVYAYAVAGQFGTAVGLANAGKVSGTTIPPVSDAIVALNTERSGAVLYLACRRCAAMSPAPRSAGPRPSTPTAPSRRTGSGLASRRFR